MLLRLLFIYFLILPYPALAVSQVKVRLFADQHIESAIVTVTGGEYELNSCQEEPILIRENEQVAFAVYNGRVAVKVRNRKGFACDSVQLTGVTGKDFLSLRIMNGGSETRYYSGNLKCLFDLGLIVFINSIDTESYIAGVVRAESGPGRNIEYCKAQAVLARSYLYRNITRHLIDNYNMCDNTHCQVFFGITSDPVILKAALETKNLVAVYRRDSSVIVPAFHSNCGGRTSNSRDVWLAELPYLKSKTDPWCTRSRNAKWRKTISAREWVSYLQRAGCKSDFADISVVNFAQVTRQNNYRVGSFTIPFNQIRKDFNLKSSFFSVVADGDSVILSGRGYGHGVGLCQEGAMAMAAGGLSYEKIIEFYFNDVIISDINRVPLPVNNVIAEVQ
ncbi:MAG: SpoIID/LytB domain-containing protein [Bacteroidales bacterium]|jgi:stage II sporulation protein D